MGGRERGSAVYGESGGAVSEGRVVLRRPDGALVSLGPGDLVGRSVHAALRLDDPRVSSVHAELRSSAAGASLRALGGLLQVGDSPRREVRLEPGLRFAVGPVELLVVRVEPGGEGLAPTLDRDTVWFVVSRGLVEVHRQDDPGPPLEIGGLAGRLLGRMLVRRGRPRDWDALAAELWPAEARRRAAGERWSEVDERRLRNRFDQALVRVRAACASVRGPQFVVMADGKARLEVLSGDRVDVLDVEIRTPSEDGGADED